MENLKKLLNESNKEKCYLIILIEIIRNEIDKYGKLSEETKNEMELIYNNVWSS